MALTTFNGDAHVNGALSCKTFNPPSSSIDNDSIQATAGISASKLEHEYRPVFAQESATTASSGAHTVHVVEGATATVVNIKAGSVVANVGAATVDIDLLKDGASIMTSEINLTSGDSAYALSAGAIASPSLVAGDILEVKVTATAGGGTLALGLYVMVDITEAAV